MLDGLSFGEHEIIVRAFDAFGNSAQASRTFVYDQPPRLSVDQPMDFSVARPSVALAATCSDDDPAGCASIHVTANGKNIASGTSSLNQTVSLVSFDGQSVELQFEAVDSGGHVTRSSRRVYVELSPFLVEIARVEGVIWDVTPEKILYLAKRNEVDTLILRDRATRNETLVMSDPGKHPQSGFITPSGAMFVEQSGDFSTSVIYERRGDELITVGGASGGLQVQGQYALWTENTKLIRRDLTTAINTTIATDALNRGDVSADGTVVFVRSPGYGIYRYQNGLVEQIALSQDFWHGLPITDGYNILYRKRSAGAALPWSTIGHYAAGVETLLAPVELRPWEASPGYDYALSAGWIAYTRLGSGLQLQVWLRNPEGQERQVTFYGSDSYLDNLAPNGELIIRHQARRYLVEAAPGSQPREFGSTLGRMYRNGNGWEVALGNILWRVDLSVVPPTPTSVRTYLPVLLR